MAAAAPPERPRPLARLGPPFLGLVAVEFLLGMSLNLFVTLPTGSPIQVLGASPLLDLHLVVGGMLLGIAANAVRLSRSDPDRRATAVTVLGLTSGVLAFASGLDFAFSNGSPGASFGMSAGFVGLLVESGYLLHLGRSTGSAPADRVDARVGTIPGGGP